MKRVTKGMMYDIGIAVSWRLALNPKHEIRPCNMFKNIGWTGDDLRVGYYLKPVPKRYRQTR